jgi:hypothetical protein
MYKAVKACPIDVTSYKAYPMEVHSCKTCTVDDHSVQPLLRSCVGGSAYSLNPSSHADGLQNVKHSTGNYGHKEFIFLGCPPLLRGVAGYINLNHKQNHATKPFEEHTTFVQAS